MTTTRLSDERVEEIRGFLKTSWRSANRASSRKKVHWKADRLADNLKAKVSKASDAMRAALAAAKEGGA